MKINKKMFILTTSILGVLVIALSVVSISLLCKSHDTTVEAYGASMSESDSLVTDTTTVETTTAAVSTTTDTTVVETTETIPIETTVFEEETNAQPFHAEIYYEEESEFADNDTTESTYVVPQKENHFQQFPGDENWVSVYNETYFNDKTYLSFQLKDGEMVIPSNMTVPLGSTVYVDNLGYFKVVAYCDDNSGLGVCSNYYVEDKNSTTWQNVDFYSIYSNLYLYTGNDPDNESPWY